MSVDRRSRSQSSSSRGPIARERTPLTRWRIPRTHPPRERCRRPPPPALRSVRDRPRPAPHPFLSSPSRSIGRIILTIHSTLPPHRSLGRRAERPGPDPGRGRDVRHRVPRRRRGAAAARGLPDHGLRDRVRGTVRRRPPPPSNFVVVSSSSDRSDHSSRVIARPSGSARASSARACSPTRLFTPARSSRPPRTRAHPHSIPAPSPAFSSPAGNSRRSP